MKKERGYELYLQDMITSIDRIASYVHGLDFDSFEKNFLVVDAVIRNFEVIGEAAKRIPPAVQEQYPHVPWKKMYQLRNIVSHEYFDVDHETIWRIISQYLPQNGKDLKVILAEIKE